MRIGVVTWSSRRVGGVEDYLSILLPALNQAGHEVALFSEIDEPANRAPIELPRNAPAFSVAASGAASALDGLRTWKPDVIYNQGLSDPELACSTAKVAPSVFFLHSYAGTCISGGKTFTRPSAVPCDRRFGWPCLLHYFPHGCGGRSPITMWQQFVKQSSQQNMLKEQAAIITHTDHMRDEMQRHGLMAQVLPYPIETRMLAANQYVGRRWRLLFVGRMDRLKGGLMLLDALPEVLAAAKRPVHLALAGDGPERLTWEARASELRGLYPDLSIEFTGWVSQTKVSGLMLGADLLVVPSLWPEPLGSVGPAAGQLGLPSAAFRVGGIPQWLVDGSTGHLAPANPPTAQGLARAIVRCLEDPVHYASLSEGAKEMSAKFTMQRHLPALLPVLERASASR